MVKFRPRMIKEKWNKRSCLKPAMNADARRCSAPLIGVNRRASAVPCAGRYEVCSLWIGDCGLRIASAETRSLNFEFRSACEIRNPQSAIGKVKYGSDDNVS